MLYVLLYFKADILHKEQAVMREIVDKFFPDNWIISLYMGNMVVNLGEAWQNYKAANDALANTLTASNIKHQSVNHLNKLADVTKEVAQHLTEGFLTKEYLLTHLNKVCDVFFLRF